MTWLADVPRLAGTPLGGLVRGAVGCALAGIPRAWIVTPTREEAARLQRALAFHRPDALGGPASVLAYPADDGRPWDATSPDPLLPAQRLAARDAWERGERVLLVAPAKALLQKVPATVGALQLRVGQDCTPRDVLSWLTARGYLAAQRADAPGTVSIRGGVVDAWPLGSPLPLRVEWFDDSVDSIRVVDPTGRSPARKVKEARMLPAREAALDAASAERAAAYLHAVAAERDAVSAAERRRVLTDLRNGVWFPGVEEYLPALTDLVTLRPDAPLYVIEPSEVKTELSRAEEQILARWDALEPEDRPLLRPAERWARARDVDLSGAVPVTLLAPAGAVDLRTRDNAGLKPTDGELAPFARTLKDWAREGRAVTIVADGAHRVEHLRALLEPHGVEPGTGRAAPGDVTIDIADLSDGFQSEEAVFVTTDEIFGARRDRGGAPRAGGSGSGTSFRRAALASFGALRSGDLIVHARHGIGQYQGLSRMPLGEVEGDFVCVVYRDGAKLYVPVTRMDLLSPYRQVGEGALPRLDKLGGATWETRRAKVRDAIVEMAHGLLRLYARRKLARAEPFHPGPLSDRFAATFPFVETPDQEAAIDAVLADLDSEEPMDRLLIGDVGFGKTEVAMRAAFAVAESGGQVAVLCPTTLLAHQHWRNFRERMAELPLRVELLARGTDEKAVLEGLAGGGIDVVVGTTKMLGRGVRFKRLGLVVVDEEHRFGVKQKEQLKRISAGAHYLAMSATPIPRSLHMALAGIRAMSVLATPPIGRQPVRTEIVRFSKERIREDVLHELRRGGQVFFVHNRVQSIQGVAQWLAKVVPEARVAVAHGQMEEGALEKVMMRFLDRRIDVLVCTTIVESGVDISNANTMIVNRADTFGLAQLYQLRGRIGRSPVRAHCTLLVAGSGDMRKEAARRLRALQENSELGSNFALASADLELRGGGELLGDKQHGHIAAIGFDAYLELLEEAVAVARGEDTRAQVDPEIEVSLPALLPEAWIEPLPERLDAYQQLALARTRDEIRRTLDALEARWGPPPDEAVHLGWLSGLRVACRDLGIARLTMLKVRAIAELAPASRVNPATLERLTTREPNRWRRASDTTVELRLTPEEAAHPFRVLEFVTQRLAEDAKQPQVTRRR